MSVTILRQSREVVGLVRKHNRFITRAGKLVRDTRDALYFKLAVTFGVKSLSAEFVVDAEAVFSEVNTADHVAHDYKVNAF